MASGESSVHADTSILNNVLEAIGDTPLIRINKLAQGIRANVLAKEEHATADEQLAQPSY